MSVERTEQARKGLKMIQHTGIDSIANATVGMHGGSVNRIILGLLKEIAYKRTDDEYIAPKIKELAKELYPEAS